MINWALGQQLDGGKYVLQDFLGGGGFGNTYRALSPRTGKLFAIKTLNQKQQSQPDFTQRQTKFINEALRLARCSHPNIVEVYEMVEADGLYGMVMEYISGQTLAEYVEDNGALSEATALSIIKQAGDALTFIHERGFLHRDVKPDNIILRQDTQVPVLIDFGLAREVTVGKLQSMTNQLTECYAPIEQYERRGEFGASTDVYALAATLYTVLTNKLPLPAKFRADGDIPLVEPKRYNSNISSRVNDAIIKGMALQPQDRPQSVQAWLELLIPSSDVQPISAVVLAGELLIPSSDVQLISAVGMDYTTLRNLLAAGQWREADEETARVMLKVAGREKERWLYDEDINKFPCEDLRTIDQLWVKYSKGRFGFSVQKRIWIDCGGQPGDWEIYMMYCDRIGWRKKAKIRFFGWREKVRSVKYYNELTFNLNAPGGHLPVPLGRSVVDFLCFRDALFSRVETCKL